MYILLKNSHLALIALSLLLFIIRFIWMQIDSKIVINKWMRAAVHIANSLLLITGLALIHITKFMPFRSGGEWLTEKLFCIIAYMSLGYLALHHSRGRLFRIFAFCGALGWIYLAASLAITKTPYY